MIGPCALRDAIARSVIGQREVVEGLLLSLIAGGHILIEGPPGLAKTLACRAMAQAIGGSFQRIQFTADVLPSDVIGTRVFDQRTAEFRTVAGPIFANAVLADEINRAPAKVQSALLESMQERQVTIAGETLALPDPFLVMATMNPSDCDGTYALPSAQLDRFLLKVESRYPHASEEGAILARFAGVQAPPVRDVVSLDDVLEWRASARAVYLDAAVERYLIEFVLSTRKPSPYVERGASPRATLAPARLARAKAFVCGRDYVVPNDVRALAQPVFQHRMVFGYQVAADGIEPPEYIRRMIECVPIP